MNNLFQQVNELIKERGKVTSSSIPVSIGGPQVAINPGNTNTSDSGLSQLVSNLQSQINALSIKVDAMPNQIIDGLNVYAKGNNIVAVTTGKAKTSDGIVNLTINKDLSIPQTNNVSCYIPIDTTILGVCYMVLNGGSNPGIVTKTSIQNDELIIAKVIINVIGGDIFDDSNGTNNYIVSGKDLAFGSRFRIDDDTRLEISSILDHLLAENLYGSIRLSEGLTITNLQNSVQLDSVSMKILNSGVVFAQFNKDGVYFLQTNGQTLAQYTKDGAIIGNIQITPNSLRSLNFVSGSKGFTINDTGHAEFNDVKVRGNITALSGTIGRWTIGIKQLKDVNDTTGLAPDDYPFYAGSTYNNRANAPFRVNTSGKLNATGATISGNITANNINANSGTIGKWTITPNNIHSDNSSIILNPIGSGEIKVGNSTNYLDIVGGNTPYIQSSNYSNSVTSPKGFKLSADGSLNAVDGIFSGKLQSNVFVKNQVNVAGGNIILATSTRLALSATNSVTTLTLDSNVFSVNDIIKVSNSSEYILVTVVSASVNRITITRGFNSTTPVGYNNKATIYKVGVKSSTNKGYIELLGANNVINIHNVSASTTNLNDNIPVQMGLLTQGTYAGKYGLYASVAQISGNLTATTLTARSGTIGGWNIGTTKLTGNTFNLDSSGKMYMGNINSGYIKIDSTGEYSPFSLWIGNEVPTISNFRIDGNGTLYPNNIYLGENVVLSGIYNTQQLEANFMEEYNGDLYLLTSYSQNLLSGCKLYKYNNILWSLDLTHFTTSTQRATGMQVCDGFLYFSIESSGKYFKYNGTILSSGTDTTDGYIGTGLMKTYNNKLYVASNNTTTLYKLSGTWNSIWTPPSGYIKSFCVHSGLLLFNVSDGVMGHSSTIYSYNELSVTTYYTFSQSILSIESDNNKNLFISTFSGPGLEVYILNSGNIRKVYSSGYGYNIKTFVYHRNKMYLLDKGVLEYNIIYDTFCAISKNVPSDYLCGKSYSIDNNLYIAGVYTNSGPGEIYRITSPYSKIQSNYVSGVSGFVLKNSGDIYTKNLTVNSSANILGSLNMSKSLYISDTTDSTLVSNGSINTLGGVGIKKSLRVGGSVVLSTTGTRLRLPKDFIIDYYVDGSIQAQRLTVGPYSYIRFGGLNVTGWGITPGILNNAFGDMALVALTSGSSNTGVGYNAGAGITTGSNNVAVGRNAMGTITDGSNNIGIGFFAGAYETGSSKLFIDTFNRSTEAGCRTGAIIYGVMNSTVGNQTLTINAKLGVNTTPSVNLHIQEAGTTGQKEAFRIEQTGNSVNGRGPYMSFYAHAGGATSALKSTIGSYVYGTGGNLVLSTVGSSGITQALMIDDLQGIKLSKTLYVSGVTTLHSNLIVSGTTTLKGTVTCSGTINSIQVAKAWVCFDSANNTGGYCVVKSNYNVSSVTYNGTGDITVNFKTAMKDAYYVMMGGGIQTSNTTNGPTFGVRYGTTPSTTSVRVMCMDDSGSAKNATYQYLTFLGN